MSTFELADCDKLEFKSVEEYKSVDESTFEKISQYNRPAILKNCCFGDCMKKWTLEYLTNKLENESIVIHESENSDLDFLGKNFKYQSCLFQQFSKQLRNRDKSNLHVYLRSTNRNPRAKKPARIEKDFPNISDDFQPPNFIPYGQNNRLYHSSVLRIASSNVQIWTHFDLYDNVLCQIIGTKRVILLPPEDIKYLYIKGDKSLVNDFDNLHKCLRKYPLVRKTTPFKCLIGPGDVLFIPALWWHNIRTVSDCDKGYSIGFNVFWRDKLIDSESHYADCDVYGNKNLTPFDAALSNLDKAIQHIEKMPGKYKTFYKFMLFNILKSKLFPDDLK